MLVNAGRSIVIIVTLIYIERKRERERERELMLRLLHAHMKQSGHSSNIYRRPWRDANNGSVFSDGKFKKNTPPIKATDVLFNSVELAVEFIISVECHQQQNIIFIKTEVSLNSRMMRSLKTDSCQISCLKAWIASLLINYAVKRHAYTFVSLIL